MNSIEQAQNDLVLVTGFGDKGIPELAAFLNEHRSFSSTHIIRGVPWYRAYEDPWDTADRITRGIDAIESHRKILIGDSLGALYALVRVCRKKMQDIFKLILIDGPLREDVEVNPAKLAHRLFFRQYKGRKEMAHQFFLHRHGLDLSRIVTMGTEEDRIVPPAAKRLDGVEHISLPYRGHRLRPEIVGEKILEVLGGADASSGIIEATS